MNNLMRFLTDLLRRPAPTERQLSAATPVTPAPPAPVTEVPSNRSARNLTTTGGAAMAEIDIRIQILNSFLTAPHGKLTDLAPLHTGALERDPLFYGHLAAWYAGRGEVRDHKVLFV